MSADAQPARSGSEPRELTADERRWINRLQRCFDAMPETLKGFHSPGSITFFDRDDPYMNEKYDAATRQQNALGHVGGRAVGRIGEGDW